jgi:hypothetical protein
MARRSFHEEDETPEDLTPDAFIEPVGDFLKRFFVPAPNIAQAELLLSTAELFYQVDQHAPKLVPLDVFREVLIALDFVEEHTDDGFFWLLKKVS